MVSTSPDEDRSNLVGDSENVGPVRVVEPSQYYYVRSPRCWEMAGCLVFFVVTFVIMDLPFTPRQRPIPFQLLENSGDYVRNLTIDKSFEGKTISSVLLIFISNILPLLIQEMLGYMMLKCSQQKSLYDMHATLCIYLVAFSINSIVTDSVKVYMGCLQPIFCEMCQPNKDYSECAAENGGGDSIRKSFPSGHSSFSFNGLMLLTLYVHSRFGMGHRLRGHRHHALLMAS
ncbi:hypothetical protein ACA910_002652 [Epithemia clementina (nom. ined.)]